MEDIKRLEIIRKEGFEERESSVEKFYGDPRKIFAPEMKALVDMMIDMRRREEEGGVIVWRGIARSGKTTAAEKLVKVFEEHDIPAVFTDFDMNADGIRSSMEKFGSLMEDDKRLGVFVLDEMMRFVDNHDEYLGLLKKFREKYPNAVLIMLQSYDPQRATRKQLDESVIKVGNLLGVEVRELESRMFLGPETLAYMWRKFMQKHDFNDIVYDLEINGGNDRLLLELVEASFGHLMIFNLLREIIQDINPDGFMGSMLEGYGDIETDEKGRVSFEDFKLMLLAFKQVLLESVREVGGVDDVERVRGRKKMFVWNGGEIDLKGFQVWKGFVDEEYGVNIKNKFLFAFGPVDYGHVATMIMEQMVAGSVWRDLQNR